MSTLLLGFLMAVSLLQMFRLKSWVISAAIWMLLTSVALSVTTDFHAINHAVSILVMVIATVLLQQCNLRFGDLLCFNALLLIHVIAAYISDISALVMTVFFVALYLLIALLKNKPWLDWLFTLVLNIWWLVLGLSYYWLFSVLLFSVFLLKKESKINIIKTNS